LSGPSRPFRSTGVVAGWEIEEYLSLSSK
jgi:hypothetical protein